MLFVILFGWFGKNGHGEEEKQTAFEICVVVPKRNVEEKDETCDCIEFLVKELRNVGFVVERILGLTDSLSRLASSFSLSLSFLLFFWCLSSLFLIPLY